MGDRASTSRMTTIGITQRTTPLVSTWTGDLRVRFTDFQVNEITEDGSVVHLTKIGVDGSQGQATPQATGGEQEKSKEPQTQKEGAPKEEETPKLTIEEVEPLANIGGAQFAKDLLEMYNNADDSSNLKKRITAEPTEDKAKRGQIHQEVRRIFNSKIETTTDSSGAIVGFLAPPRRGRKRNRGGRDRRNAGEQPEEKPAGEYLHFTLYKDNRDTFDAVNQIARMLRVKPQMVAYAGTKDRRASTNQRCSVRHVHPRQLSGINAKLRSVFTGDYEYKERPIHLGELKGNEFAITIKNCQLNGQDSALPVSERLDALRANVQPALDHMVQHGWLNYFGHQRFGTHEIGTHEVGKLILSDRIEDAINALLAYDPEIADKAEKGEDLPEEMSKRDEYLRHQACMLYRTGKDYQRAEKIMPRRFGAETCILRHLNRSGLQSRKDLLGAIIHITRGLRTMYLHAYQSHVWNHAASKRWALHGEKVVKGDLILVEAEQKPLVAGQDQDGDDIINPVEEDDGPVTQTARPLTEEEAASGRYTIHDIVLPSPGYEVVYPDNEIGAFYTEFMGREENGGLDPNNMRRLRREFSLPGRYRKLMNRFLVAPSVEFKAYADDTEQMKPTDLDLLQAARKTNENGKRRHEESDEGPASKKLKNESEEAVVEDGSNTKEEEQAAPEKEEEPRDKIAVVVSFQLGSSAYATVTLRELMGDPPEQNNKAEATE